MDSDSISTLRPGSTLHAGTYRIISYIANGGFGITYLAEHTLLEKRVVIKELYVKEWCNRDSGGFVTVGVTANRARYSKLHAKFISEAKVQCHLDHPGVVKVTDVFEENGTAYYVMDYIDGESLKDRMRRLGHGMSEREALGYIRQVCDALAYVHSTGRLHLDIKPGNIMIDRGGHAILIDFGVSKQYDAESGENHSTLLGATPGYSSPEQKSGEMKHFSPASDIYSLGATLYNLLTGKVIPTTDLRVSGEPIPPLPANITSATREAIDAALQLQKDHRPQTIAEFLEILDGAPVEAELVEDVTPETTKKTVTTRITHNTNFPKSPKPSKLTPQNPLKPLATTFNKQIAPETSAHRPDKKWFRNILIGVIVIGLIATVLILVMSRKGNNMGTNGSVENVAEVSPMETPTDKGITFDVKGVKFDMIKVDGGTFWMGCDDSDLEYPNDEERPIHYETVKDFYIGSTEVTQNLWEAVMGSNPSKFRGGDCPVENVSWDDCQVFLERLNDLTGRQFRLPTEVEWEYAARGGNRSLDYSGSNDIESVAWYSENSDGKTHPVASKQSNEFGLYDMSGNVDEWVSDLWCDDYNSYRDGSYDGNSRVLRGGAWINFAHYCRSYSRGCNSADYKSYFIGLRLAL